MLKKITLVEKTQKILYQNTMKYLKCEVLISKRCKAMINWQFCENPMSTEIIFAMIPLSNLDERKNHGHRRNKLSRRERLERIPRENCVLLDLNNIFA